MSWRSVAVLALIASALGAYVLLVDPHLRSNTEEVSSGRRLLDGLAVERVRRIRIEGSSSGVVLVRGKTEWRLKKPLDAPADEAAVRRMLSALEFANVTRTFPRASSPPSVGLDPPRRRVSLYFDAAGQDRAFEIQIGRADPTGAGVYASFGGRIHVIPRGVVEILDVDGDALRQRDPVRFAVGQMMRIELVSPTQSIRLERQADRWMVRRGASWVRATPDRVYRLAGAIAALRVRRFVAADGEVEGIGVTISAAGQLAEIRFAGPCPTSTGANERLIGWASEGRWRQGCVDERDVVDILGQTDSKAYLDTSLTRTRAADLEQLVFEVGGHSLEISRDGTSWVWRRDQHGGEADGEAIREALDRLRALRGELEWMSTDQMSRIGVGGGLVVRLVTEGKKSEVLRVGATKGTRVPVQRDNEPGVLWLPSSLNDIVTGDPLHWRTREILRVPGHEVRRIEVLRGAEREVVERVRGQWRVSSPVKIAADAQLMAQLLTRVDPLRAVGFVRKKKAAAQPVRVAIAVGSESETQQGRSSGSVRHRLTLWRGVDGRCLGRLSDEPLFEVSGEDCRLLYARKARRTLFRIDGARLSEIDLRGGPAGRVSLHKQAGGWIAQTAGGASPVDPATVARFVRWLVALRAADQVAYRGGQSAADWAIEVGHPGAKRQSCRFDRSGSARCNAAVVYRMGEGFTRQLRAAWPEL